MSGSFTSKDTTDYDIPITPCDTDRKSYYYDLLINSISSVQLRWNGVKTIFAAN